jgi:hypothetical protein
MPLSSRHAEYAALTWSAEVVPPELAGCMDNPQSLGFLLVGLQVAQLALLSTILSFERIGYAVGIVVASSSLLGLRLVFGAGASLLGTVSLDNVLDRAAFLPVCAGLTGDGSASWTSLAVLDEQLVKRILELVRDADVAMAVSSVAVHFWFAFLGRLWKPPKVLTEAEDVSINRETGTLETEQRDT